jgi:hypothetical protein
MARGRGRGMNATKRARPAAARSTKDTTKDTKTPPSTPDTEPDTEPDAEIADVEAAHAALADADPEPDTERTTYEQPVVATTEDAIATARAVLADELDPASKVTTTARPACRVKRCTYAEAFDNAGLCGGHWSTRADLRKAARRRG